MAPTSIDHIASDWNPPQTFEEYRLVCRLSVGGMGEVYLGHDTLLDRAVAIKFLHGMRSDKTGDRDREQILNEARAAARLSHPNVVTIYRVSEIDHHPMIISEFVRGTNLDDTPKPMPWQRVVEIGLSLSRGLAAAHRRGVLHLDIKPGNVIISHDGELKLLDFGLAKLLDFGLTGPSGMSPSLFQRAKAKTQAALAQTMELSAEDSRKAALSSREVASKPRNPAPNAFSSDDLLRESRVSVSSTQIPSIPPPPSLPDAAISSTDALRPPGKSGESGAVTTEMERAKLKSLSGSMSLMRQDNLSADWALPPTPGASRIAGTPLYMAPEIWRGEPGTRRADIYSCGALLFELCTGSPPFQDVPLAELPAAVNQRDAPPVQSVAPKVDPRLAAIIDRCLRRDPAQRYGSGDELRDALEQLTPSQRADSLPEGNPYRGLLAFEAEHRGLFFGRKSEIGTILERLRTEPMVLVVADSGVGKSSLCRAGVLPLIADGALGGGRTWSIIPLIPGKHPLRALSDALSPFLGIPDAELAARVRNDPAELMRLMHRKLAQNLGLVLFIDQLEEIVTIGEPEEARVVSLALGYLCARSPGLHMLMTVRSDFLARVASVGGLGDELSRGLYLLRPLSADKMQEAIVGPAHIKGVSFESQELINLLVETTAKTDGGLPLLQFALTELWEARRGDTITKAALDAIGGVSGALARHADSVMLSLPEDQRKEARRMLMALVTMEGTRARRTHDELARSAPAKHALEALVRARLLVARDIGEGVAYEVAHEALLKGWDALRRWLEEHSESRAVRQRLEAATAEWLRLSKSRDVLWNNRQLAEIGLLETADIGPKERAFVDASERSVRRKQLLRRAMLLIVPCVGLALYSGYQVRLQRELHKRVDEQVRIAAELSVQARRINQEIEQLRQQAFAAFDGQHGDEGESKWARALELSSELEESYSKASQALEAGLTIDAKRTDVRSLLADTLFERALTAERDKAPGRLRDLLARLALYDTDGTRRRRFEAPAHLDLETEPSGAVVQISRYVENKQHQLILTDERMIGSTALRGIEVPPGSHLLVIRSPGRVVVRYPVVFGRGESLKLRVDLPREDQVPPGYVYIPPGRFIYGSSDEPLRNFLSTVPAHTRQTDAYLISKGELTFGEWIEYVSTLPPAERAKKQLRHIVGSIGGDDMDLEDLGNNVWRLSIKHEGFASIAKNTELFEYPARKWRAKQNWLRFPVGGITKTDAEDYAAWLNKTGKLPGARLCTELEWERAARGADDREYPNGNMLDETTVNAEHTYGSDRDARGVDEVGSHPASDSPFLVSDMAGNVFEWASSVANPGEAVMRSSPPTQGGVVARSNNRNTPLGSTRDASLGTRICASFTDRGSPSQ